MKVLIFGLSELLGRSLYKKLKEKNFNIIGFSKNKKGWFNDKFHFFENFFEKDFEGNFYIYLSAVSADFQVEKNYMYSFEVNVVNPLKIMNRIKKGHFIYISSASVYKNKLFPIEEEAQFHSSLYGSHKYAAEGLLKALAEKKNIKFTALRFPRIYGPFMQRNPIADFLIALRNKKNEVNLYDDFDATYEYIFSYDCAEIILNIITNSIEGIYNCGTGEIKKVKDIKEIFEKITEKIFKINFIKKRKGVDILDSEKLREKIKIKFTKMEEGIKLTLLEENII